MKHNFTTIFLLLIILFSAMKASAFVVFTVGGVKLICPTSTCAEMQAAGVNYESCIDIPTAMASAGGSPYQKLIRYSKSNVVLLGANGQESPLASDAVQKQFDDLMQQSGWEKKLSTIKIQPGDIGDARLSQIAGQMKLPIDNRLKIVSNSQKAKSNFIFQLNANEGATASEGISKELRLIPNGSLQYMYKNFGLGIDAGMFKSIPDFNFANYAKNFEGLGGLDFNKSIDYWKSSYFSIGPQYTFNLKVPGSGSTGAASLFEASSANDKTVSITLSLRGGLNKNNSPSITFQDSLVPGTAPKNIVVASYKAPDSIKTNGYNIKPGIAITYWFNKYFGANVTAQYMIVGGQQEFKTAYRDLKDVNFSYQQKEVWYQISRAPWITTTTKGPGNLFSIGAGVSVKLGVGKPKSELPAEQESRNVKNNPEAGIIPATTKAEPVDKRIDNPNVQNPLTKEQEKKKETERDYIRPSALSPVDGESISESDSRKPLAISWTSVTPQPPVVLIYQVKVVEMLSGQRPAAALASNKVVFEKEVTQSTTTTWTAPQSTKGEVKQYAWNVRATDKTGKSYGENNGTSEAAAFSIGQNDIDIAIDTLKVECCKNGKQTIKLTIKNNLPNTNTTLKKVWIMAVNGNFGIPYPLDISSFISPALPLNFLPSSASISQGRMNFVAIIDCIKDINSIVVKAEGERSTNMGLVTDNDLESDTLQCICNECDKIKIEIPEKGAIQYTGNALTLNAPVVVSPKKVKKITTDIVYFSYIPESDDCAPCNKDSKTYGNFSAATIAAAGFPSNGALIYGHEAVWNSNNLAGALLNGQFNFSITTPPLVKCCSARFKFCIRYSFVFDDCTECEKVVCYSFNKEGCIK